MWSKNKRTPTRRERDHIARVKALACSVCDQHGPSEAHEIKQGQWWTAVALCASCHRSDILGLSGQKRMWHLKKMTELDALAVTVDRLMAQAYA